MSTDTDTETVPTPREALAEIKLRITDAQDAVGWARQDGSEFDETIASSVVEYGRCLRDLATLVQALLPEGPR